MGFPSVGRRDPFSDGFLNISGTRDVQSTENLFNNLLAKAMARSADLDTKIRAVGQAQHVPSPYGIQILKPQGNNTFRSISIEQLVQDHSIAAEIKQNIRNIALLIGDTFVDASPAELMQDKPSATALAAQAVRDNDFDPEGEEAFVGPRQQKTPASRPITITIIDSPGQKRTVQVKETVKVSQKELEGLIQEAVEYVRAREGSEVKTEKKTKKETPQRAATAERSHKQTAPTDEITRKQDEAKEETERLDKLSKRLNAQKSISRIHAERERQLEDKQERAEARKRKVK